MIRFGLVLLISLFLGNSGAADDAAFTGYRKVCDAAFPAESMLRKYGLPEARLIALWEGERKQTISEVEILGDNWLAAIGSETTQLAPFLRKQFPTGLPEDPHLLKRPKESMARAPLYVCSGNCPCTEGSYRSCVISKKVGEVWATALLISDVDLKGVARVEGEPPNRKVHEPREQRSVMRDLLFQVGLWRIYGGSTQGFAIQALSKRLVAWSSNILGKTSARNGGRSCAKQGEFGVSEFGKESFELLRGAGKWKRLPPAWRDCGVTLLKPFLKETYQLPEACRWIVDYRKWSAPEWRALFSHPLEVGRCADEECRRMTCANSSDGSGRLMRMGDILALELSETACDGSQPKEALGFYSGVIPLFARESVMKGETAERATSACAKALAALIGASNPAVSPGLSSEVRDSDLDVQLLE